MEATTRTDGIRVAEVRWDEPLADHIRRIRLSVFVEEQQVPLDEEIDERDPQAFHVLAVDEVEGPCGTARLFADPCDPTCARIGRMAVSRSHRGRGVGRLLVDHLLGEARRRGFRCVRLSSQVHVISFYEQFGFRTTGEEYLDAGIRHREMEMAL